MKLEQPKEYQTIRLFAILGLLTLMLVLLFKVVLFAPQNYEGSRLPSNNLEMPNMRAPTDEPPPAGGQNR